LIILVVYQPEKYWEEVQTILKDTSLTTLLPQKCNLAAMELNTPITTVDSEYLLNKSKLVFKVGLKVKYWTTS
jgi:hypothetical protein